MPEKVFSKSKRDRNLKTPVTVNIPEPRNDAERRLHEYILEGCLYKMPRLLPFVLENTSMMELAKHLFLHNTGSQAVFVGYTRHIRNFCKWANTTPDKIINVCKDKEQGPNLKGVAQTERELDEYAGFPSREENRAQHCSPHLEEHKIVVSK